MRSSIRMLAIVLCLAVTVRAQCSDAEFGDCADGETCYAACSLEYDGYKSALCTGTTYGEADLSHCTPRTVSLFSYGIESISAKVGQAIPTLNLRTDGSFSAFSISPELPAGLSLNTENGMLSGTPSAAAASAEYIVTGTGNTEPKTLTITIVVEAIVCPALDSFPEAADGADSLSTSACPTGYQGTAKRHCSNGHFGDIDVTGCTHKQPTISYSQPYINKKRLEAFETTPTIENEFTSVTASNLPAGVEITSKGTIAGVPTVVGTTSVTVTVTGPGGTATTTVTIVVTNADCAGMMDKDGNVGPKSHNQPITFNCDEGYQGTWSYTCDNGVYKNKNTLTCFAKTPKIVYPATNYELTVGDSLDTGRPYITNIVTYFEAKDLPEGLYLDQSTGVVNGTLTQELSGVSFTVTGYVENSATALSSKWTFSLSVNAPSCAATEDFSKVNSGSSATFKCPEGYEGEMKRRCATVNGRGQWKTPESFCQKKPDFTFLIICVGVLVVCVIVCCIGCCVKSSRSRAKTTKSLKTTKAASKTASKPAAAAAKKPTKVTI